MTTILSTVPSLFLEHYEEYGLRFLSSTDQLIVEVPMSEYFRFCCLLRAHETFRFSTLIDLVGVDYSDYHVSVNANPPIQRFAVVLNLLSVSLNQRLLVRVFCEDDVYPSLESIIPIWPAANWYEREAFDLFGIVFSGHHDLRRILTDYGFVGHPFRKDFPISGEVEVRFDPQLHRVVYQPVSIEPREIIPRVVREDNYGHVE